MYVNCSKEAIHQRIADGVPLMKIVVLEPIHAEAMRLLRGEAEVVAWDDPAKHDWSDADAVIVRAATVTREQIAAAPKLKVIGKHGIGVNAIDVAQPANAALPSSIRRRAT